MSRQTAASPWWADVQHLRPREEREADERALVERTEAARRFGRRSAESPRPDSRRSAESPRAEGRRPETARRGPHRDADPRERAAERARRAREIASDDAPVVFAEDVPAAEPRADVPTGSLVDLLGPEPVTAPPPAAEPAPVEDWLKPRHADARIENGRRTIEIRGQVARVPGVTAPAEVAEGAGRRRPARTRADRIAGRPDRIALWAFLLGIVLILVAAFSDSEAAHGAVQALEAGRAATGR